MKFLLLGVLFLIFCEYCTAESCALHGGKCQPTGEECHGAYVGPVDWCSAGESCCVDKTTARQLFCKKFPLTGDVVIYPSGKTDSGCITEGGICQLNSLPCGGYKTYVKGLCAGGAGRQCCKGSTQECPKVVSCAVWNCPQVESTKIVKMNASIIIIQHTLTDTDKPRCTANIIAKIADEDKKSYPDINFHYLIDKLGRVYEGRRLIRQGNILNIGLIGDFTEKRPSKATDKTLQKLISCLKAEGKVQEFAKVTTFPDDDPAVESGLELGGSELDGYTTDDDCKVRAQCYDKDTEYSGTIVGFEANIKTAEACEVKCRFKSGCAAWTWESNDCVLRATTGTATAKTGAVSGPKKCKGAPVLLTSYYKLPCTTECISDDGDDYECKTAKGDDKCSLAGKDDEGRNCVSVCGPGGITDDEDTYRYNWCWVSGGDWGYCSVESIKEDCTPYAKLLGSVFFIYNKKYPNARLSMNDDQELITTESFAYGPESLWIIRNATNQQGYYSIYNAKYMSYRIYKSDLDDDDFGVTDSKYHYPDQYWRLETQDESYFRIHSMEYPPFTIVKYGIKEDEIETTEKSDAAGNIWELRQRFTANCFTKEILRADNREGTTPISQTREITTGFKKTSSSSFSTSVEISASMTASAELYFFSASATTTLTTKIKSTLSTSTEFSKSTKVATTFTVPPGKLYIVSQAVCDFKSLIASDDTTMFTSYDIKESD